ncbi:hypothetical protein AZE42_08575, partial [Rhizopogon vesiculosus]
ILFVKDWTPILEKWFIFSLIGPTTKGVSSSTCSSTPRVLSSLSLSSTFLLNSFTMRFPIVILALSATFSSAFAALTARQAALPNCASTCLADADYGTCASTDDTCLCNSPAFINSTTTCIQATCTGSDLTNAEEASQALCAAVGVTLTASSSSTGTATSTGTSKATSTSTSGATSTPTFNAASSNSINVLTGAAAFAIMAAAAF